MNDPNWRLPEAPWFPLTSDDVENGARLPVSARAGYAGGEDRSPALSWTDVPEGTKSLVLTAYDPDAPTGSGLWHWVVVDLPADTRSLPANAGDPESGLLPDGVRVWRNDLGNQAYLGAAPPAGHGEHRYYFTVTALDVDRLDVADDASAAVVGFTMLGHVLGRGQLVGTSETPAD